MVHRNAWLIVGASCLVMMLAGCAGMFHRTFHEDIPRSELQMMGWSLDRYEQAEVVLTQEDQAKVQASLGHPLEYYPKGLGYYREIKRHYGEIGDIVPLRMETPYGRLLILARIRGDRMDKVKAIENPLKEGKPLVSDVFLSQFLGRTASSSYEVVIPPQGPLTTQDGIRPIDGEPAVSQEIAGRLHELMAIHAVDRF